MAEESTTSLRDLALSLQSPRAVADTCLRYRYEESPDLLAYMASKGELDYAGVLELARGVLAGEVPAEDATARLDVQALDALVRLMAGRQVLDGAFAEPADLSQVVRLLGGDEELDPLSARIAGQVNLAEGRREQVRAILDDSEGLDEDTEWILSTELAHPANGAPPQESMRWLELFNRRFVEFGLLPIVIRDGSGAPFDRVAVEVPGDRYVDGPMVTVVMSVFKPDQSFRTAVESLIAQTWRNLEILIFDDCSPSEYDQLLAEVTSLDPRIRFERMAENGGTYVIRNAALARARGVFVAFQDSDDWAHPERIQRQVQPLLDDPELVATHCRCVRVFDDLHTLSVGMNSFRRGEASTVFRRELIDALGGFDETRKSADNEFFERVEAAFGPDAVVNLPDVLMMTQLTPGSLSRDELKFGWHHPSRAAYVQARGHWHREIMAGRDAPGIVAEGPRKIPAPHYHLTGQAAPVAGADVLWIADWRDRVQEQTHESALVETTAGQWSTLFAHAEDIHHAEKKRRPFCDELLRLQAAGITRQVLWPDQTNAAVVIVTDPMLLNLTRSPDAVSIRAGRLVVVASALTTAGDLPYDVLRIQRSAQRMFGAEVDWLPGHAGIAGALTDAGAASVLEPRLVMPPLRVRRRLTSGLRGGHRLVIGVTRPDPDADLAPWLPADETLDIRVRWGGPAVRAVPFKHREGWLRFDHSMPESDFLAQLDVMALVPGRTLAVPGAAYAAMAQGVVVLADQAYEPLLGGAAVYAAADGAQVKLKELLADPEAVDEQRERGYACCLAAGDRLRGLIATLTGKDVR